MGKMLVLAMVAIGLGLLIGRLSYRGGTPPVKLVDPIQLPRPTEPSTAIPTNVQVRNPVTQQPPPPQEAGWTNPAPEADSGPWEQRLDKILMEGGDVNDKSDMIRNLMTAAPDDAQVELAQHLINMTQDDHYDGAAELLTNATTQTSVATVLMNDLLNRRNSLKLPMLLAIARNDEHPLKDQARDMLELFLQADYSTNWDQWQSAVDDWLQQNP
jgi:hypothetical protein